ncbi:retrotransposon protein, putative, ty1-copia subclass [Tanacetum coccineum]
MVRSMFNLTNYALESAVRILNMVPTKKVDKTPYEIWHGKAPNLSYLKVWGCEAYVKRDSADKLQQRTVKCIFVGYPKETIGYYFYFPAENKVIVARYGDFLERDLISQEFSGRDYDLEDDHMDTLPSENMNKIISKFLANRLVGVLSDIVSDVQSAFAPNRLCLNMEVIWQGAMDEEINSMKVNKVWIEVDHPSNLGLVAKGCTQTYGIDYEETFSLIADIRAIRILIAIAALKEVKDYLGKCFSMKDLGEAAYILGIKSLEIDLSGAVHTKTGKSKEADNDWPFVCKTTSEYMAALEAAMEAVWIRKFVGDLRVMPSIKKAY